MDMLIVGLGNPGRRYAETRHNVGFMTVDELARRHGVVDVSERMGAWSGRARIAERDVLLVKPQTFMNASGEAVGRLWRWYRLSLEQLLVVGDDIDLPFGRLRLRARGSAGGHNGLRSIFAHVGSQEVARLKIGVGRSAERDARDHVLTSFSPEERAALPDLLGRAADAVEWVLRDGIIVAMNAVNPQDDGMASRGGAQGAAVKAAHTQEKRATADRDADQARPDVDLVPALEGNDDA
jgi:PTH1 family peptidyl-tRNA hydrolase